MFITNDIEMNASYSNIQALQFEYNNALELNQTTMDVFDTNKDIHNIDINIVNDMIIELLGNHQLLLSKNSRMLLNSNTNFTSANNICG